MAESIVSERTTLLVVEDDPATRRVLALALRQGGFDIDEVETGSEAVDRLEAGGVSGVVLDLMLPDQRSCDVLNWLHAHGEHPPWLVITSMDRSDAVSIDQAIEQRFVAKPFDPWALIERLTAMTERDREE